MIYDSHDDKALNVLALLPVHSTSSNRDYILDHSDTRQWRALKGTCLLETSVIYVILCDILLTVKNIF